MSCSRSGGAATHRLHPLEGNRKGLRFVRASGNRRIVFRLEDGRVIDVDLMDELGG